MLVNLLKDNLLNFYTIRVIILWIISLVYLFISNNMWYKNLVGITMLFMLSIISWIGFTLVHIYPKYFYFPVNNYYMKGKEIIIFDILLHQLPFFIQLILLKLGVWSFNKSMIPLAIMINLIYFLIYILQVNPYKIYLHT